MSRAPAYVPRAAPERSAAPPVAERPPANDWFEIDERKANGAIVMVTTEPMSDATGRLGRWYQKRYYHAGRWHRTAAWVDPRTLNTIEPQPTHWRPDPLRGVLAIPVE